MSASTQLPSTAPASSWAIATAIETRLRAVLNAPPAGSAKPASGPYVRWSAPPDREQVGMTWAEEGLTLVWGAPQPVVNDGAGRAGQRVRRVVQVWVVTRSNADVAGATVIAYQRHTALEDLVVNSLNDLPPPDYPTGAQAPIGITLKWIPGGDDIRRQVKVAPDTFVSCMLYEVVYPQPQHVRREVFS